MTRNLFRQTLALALLACLALSMPLQVTAAASSSAPVPTVQAAKTRVIDFVKDSAGNPLKGKVTFILTQKSATSADGLVVASPTVSATLDSTGKFDVQLYPSASLSPVSYYQVYVTTGAGNQTLLGIYNIPSSSTVVTLAPYKVTDANLAAQYTFASLPSVLALTNTVSTATFTSLLGATTTGTLPKRGSDSLVNSAVAETSTAVISTKKIVAPSFEGSGAGLTGIGTGTGGVLNTGSTTIGADTDVNGVGKVSIQTGGVERIGVEADGTVGIPGGLSTPVLDKGGTVFNVRAFGAKCDWNGTTGTDDTAAFAAAIAAAETAGGGTIFYSGKCLIQGSGAQILLTTKPLIFQGSGMNRSRIIAGGTATAALRYKPTTPDVDSRGFTFRDGGIQPAPGSTVGWGIILDCTTTFISQFRIEHNYLGGESLQFASGAFLLTNPLGSGDGIFTSTFMHNLVWGTIQAIDAGDSLNFAFNTVSGTGVIDLKLIAGATQLNISFNNITLSQAVALKRARKALFFHNNVEMLGAGDTGTNGAMVDLQGISTSDRILGVDITRNTFLSVLGAAVDGVRANWVSSVTVADNEFELPAGKTLTRITSNSIGTNARYNVARGASTSEAINAGDPGFFTAPVLFENLPATNQAGYVTASGGRLGGIVFVTTVPTSNPPSGQVYLYMESGVLKARGASGTITPLAAP